MVNSSQTSQRISKICSISARRPAIRRNQRRITRASVCLICALQNRVTKASAYSGLPAEIHSLVRPVFFAGVFTVFFAAFSNIVFSAIFRSLHDGRLPPRIVGVYPRNRANLSHSLQFVGFRVTWQGIRALASSYRLTSPTIHERRALCSRFAIKRIHQRACQESPTLKATFTPLRVLVACEYSGIVVAECIGDYLSREDVQKKLAHLTVFAGRAPPISLNSPK